jgi:ABC-type amino acid transport substrate-binding protein
MRRWIVWLSVSGLVLGLASGAAAATIDDVKKRGKLIAGVKTDFPPFGYVDAQGKNLGFDIELGHLFSQALFGDAGKVEFVSEYFIPFLEEVLRRGGGNPREAVSLFPCLASGSAGLTR